MRAIILLLLAICCGYGLLQLDRIDPNNYAKVYFNGYAVELNLIGFILLTLCAMLFLYLAFRFVMWLLRSPNKFLGWSKKRNEKASQQQLGQGYLSLIKGQWRKAEGQLTSKTKYSKVPYVNYLAAAQAAQQQGRLEQRDDYLKAASDVAPNETLAIALLKAQLNQQAGQHEQALLTLQKIATKAGNNPQYLALLAQSYQHFERWAKLSALLPKLKKYKVFEPAKLTALSEQACSEGFLASDNKQAFWQGLSNAEKRRVENTKVYVRHLISNKHFDEAEKCISRAQKDHYCDELTLLYAGLNLSNTSKQLKKLEAWLASKPEDPVLLLSVGRLAFKNEQFDKAQNSLQKAVELSEDLALLAQAYNLLGRLAENQKQAGKALQLYRLGLEKLVS